MISRTDRIIYGWKLPYNEIKDSSGESWWMADKWLPMMEGHRGQEFSLIVDWMQQEYIVFGLRIAGTDDEYKGWDFVQLDFKNLDVEKAKAKFSEICDAGKYESIVQEPSLFIFSQFS